MWIDKFQGLSAIGKAERQLLGDTSSIVSVPKDTVVFGPNMVPDNLLLLLEGTVRVQQNSEEGREIVLYRVRSGESCVLTNTCLLASEVYTAQGITESVVEAVMVPKTTFDDLITKSTEFRQFVFSTYSQKITELFNVIEEVAFQRIDVRLAGKLLQLLGGESQIQITHRELGIELGTAREVISRQLLEFQRRGWVEQSRGSIELKNLSGLKNLAKN